MIDLQTLLTYLTLISVPFGVFYHIMTLNNTRKNQQMQLETRQAQLFFNLYMEDISERASKALRARCKSYPYLCDGGVVFCVNVCY